MDNFQAIILGFVQGITEFLPISSTAHLRIIPALFKWNDPGTAFSAVIQLGTMFSVIIYFKDDLLKISTSFFQDIFCRGKVTLSLQNYDSKLAYWILIGTIPICFFGLLFKDPIEHGIVRNLFIISFYLILFGILLYVAELIAKQSKSLNEINMFDVFLFGLAQSFALIPGVSRSGVTLLAGLILGYKRSDAAKFSFLLSVPAVFLSGVLELKTLFEVVKLNSETIIWANLFLGVLISFISGYFSIHYLLRFFQTHRSTVFVIYRVVLGIIIIYLASKGIIH